MKQKPFHSEADRPNLKDSHTKSKEIMPGGHEEWETFFRGISQLIFVLSPWD